MVTSSRAPPCSSASRTPAAQRNRSANLAANKHDEVEWGRLKQDLAVLTETELYLDGKKFLLRGELTGDAGKALQAAGVAIPPSVIDLMEAGDA
jgi:hypothetical protein